MIFKDDFSKDQLKQYTFKKWGVRGDNRKGKYTLDVKKKSLKILTADNEGLNLRKEMALPASGYAQVIVEKLKDFPTDNRQGIRLYENAKTYYWFRFTGKKYDEEGLYKVVNGKTKQKKTGQGTIEKNNKPYKIEVWWSPKQLRMAINGKPVGKMALQGKPLKPKMIELRNFQINCYIGSLEVRR